MKQFLLAFICLIGMCAVAEAGHDRSNTLRVYVPQLGVFIEYDLNQTDYTGRNRSAYKHRTKRHYYYYHHHHHHRKHGARNNPHERHYPHYRKHGTRNNSHERHYRHHYKYRSRHRYER